MGIKQGIKKIASHLVDIRIDKWIDYNQLKNNTISISNATKNIFRLQRKRPELAETFAAAMQRQGLTEQDLIARTKEFSRLTTIYIIIASMLFFYAVYMAIYAHGFAAIISLSLSLYYLSQAFKFHFWLFQIKHRKLGCTLQEWLDSKVSSASKEQT